MDTQAVALEQWSNPCEEFSSAMLDSISGVLDVDVPQNSSLQCHLNVTFKRFEGVITVITPQV